VEWGLASLTIFGCDKRSQSAVRPERSAEILSWLTANLRRREECDPKALLDSKVTSLIKVASHGIKGHKLIDKSFCASFFV
jgi:hypothetical protein